MLSKESNSPKGQGPYSDLKTAQPYHDTEDHDEEQGFLYTPPKSQNLAARKAIIARGFNASLIVAVICLLSTALLLLYSRMCVLSTSLDEYKAENATRVQAKVAALAKPANISIIGVVFYGRRQHVDILDCYIQQNLARNGGMLDEVIFLVHSENKEDLHWLNETVHQTPEYRQIETKGAFNDMWTPLDDDNAIYIKMDDDLAYIHEDALAHMVHTLLDRPDAYAVSANMVNSPEGNWLHYHTSAIRPFIPEWKRPTAPIVHVNASTNETIHSSWRPSELPVLNAADVPEQYDIDAPPPYKGFRFLPLPNTTPNLHRTPISHAAYDPSGEGWNKWAVAAQQHYSLLANVEDDTMGRYYLGGDEGIWNMQYLRYSINLIALWGHTIKAAPLGHDDEQDITVTNPKKLGRPFLVSSHAIASHFSFSIVTKQLHSTDLMERYRGLANEKVCAKDNQKVAFAQEL